MTKYLEPTMLARGLAEPGRAWAVLRSLLKGYLYKAWYRLRGVRFRAGRNFRVAGSLRVRGPGEVVFGDNVLINGHTTPWTHTREARIVVGNNVTMNSARFGCAREITIGDWCLIASAFFADTDFHSVGADRWSDDAPVRVAPVRLSRNVWIGENAGLLPGAHIGENSVVGFGTVCMRPYPANVVILGNPGKVIGPIPNAPAAAADAGLSSSEPAVPGAAS